MRTLSGTSQVLNVSQTQTVVISGTPTYFRSTEILAPINPNAGIWNISSAYSFRINPLNGAVSKGTGINMEDGTTTYGNPINATFANTTKFIKEITAFIVPNLNLVSSPKVNIIFTLQPQDISN